MKAPVALSFHKIYIGAGRVEQGMPAQSPPFSHNVETIKPPNPLHIMRHTGIQPDTVQKGPHFRLGHRLHPHTDGPSSTIGIPADYFGMVHAVLGSKTEFLTPTAYAEEICKYRNTAGSVSAHGSRTSVGIVITHLKITAGSSFMQGHQSVCPHTETPMAYAGNLL